MEGPLAQLHTGVQALQPTGQIPPKVRGPSAALQEETTPA